MAYWQTGANPLQHLLFQFVKKPQTS